MSSAAIYVTPSAPVFVLTQVCFNGGGMVLSGNTFGPVISGREPCTTYEPGIAIPADETLSCENPNGVEANCMITGVLTR